MCRRAEMSVVVRSLPLYLLSQAGTCNLCANLSAWFVWVLVALLVCAAGLVLAARPWEAVSPALPAVMATEMAAGHASSTPANSTEVADQSGAARALAAEASAGLAGTPRRRATHRSWPRCSGLGSPRWPGPSARYPSRIRRNLPRCRGLVAWGPSAASGSRRGSPTGLRRPAAR